jgi:prevent-host-death family protein
MTNVSMATAKDRLSEFAAAAAAGHDIVITKHGKPYVKLVAIDDQKAQLLRQREALAELKAHRIARGPTGITLDEIVSWVREDRDG